MPRMTPAAYAAWLARGEVQFMGEDAIEIESDLHQQIIDHCKRKGWYFIHSRMDKPSTNGIGTPDFVIFMPPPVPYTPAHCVGQGRVICIECKRKGSKPTPAQLAAQAQLRHLGHKAEVVWSYEQFLEAIKP